MNIGAAIVDHFCSRFAPNKDIMGQICFIDVRFLLTAQGTSVTQPTTWSPDLAENTENWTEFLFKVLTEFKVTKYNTKATHEASGCL